MLRYAHDCKCNVNFVNQTRAEYEDFFRQKVSVFIIESGKLMVVQAMSRIAVYELQLFCIRPGRNLRAEVCSSNRLQSSE
jgi:hypothetical protein